MHHFFEEGEILQEVLDYVGFIPGRFYLRACSQYLYDQVSGMIHLNECLMLICLRVTSSR